MNVNVDGTPTPLGEVLRLTGVDLYNADFAIGSTLTLSDKMHGKMIRFEAACTVTIPTGLRRDFSCGWSQDGSGAITFAAADGITIQSLNGYLETGGQYAMGGVVALSSAIAEHATTFRLVGPMA